MQTTRSQLLALHDHLTERAKALMVRKNHDYSGGADAVDALANFRHASNLNLCSLPQSVLIRLTDKVSRLSTATHKTLQVQDEKVLDTILDLINYSVLLYAAFQEQQPPTHERQPIVGVESVKTVKEIDAMMLEIVRGSDLEADANC